MKREDLFQRFNTNHSGYIANLEQERADIARCTEEYLQRGGKIEFVGNRPIVEINTVTKKPYNNVVSKRSSHAYL